MNTLWPSHSRPNYPEGFSDDWTPYFGVKYPARDLRVCSLSKTFDRERCAMILTEVIAEQPLPVLCCPGKRGIGFPERKGNRINGFPVCEWATLNFDRRGVALFFLWLKENAPSPRMKRHWSVIFAPRCWRP